MKKKSCRKYRSKKLSNIIKMVIDVILSLILIVVLSPVFIICCILLFALEGAPIFYVSKRMVAHNKSITIVKFRTMVKDAKSDKYKINLRYMRDGYLYIPLDSHIYTPIGRIYERYQLVETLQLYNILFNQMSFVGNRPLPKSNVTYLSKIKGWENRFHSPAGLTGIAQVIGKLSLNPDQRLKLESMYSYVYNSENGNILICDAYIICYTVQYVLTGKPIGYDRAIEILTRANGGVPPYDKV